MRMKELYAFGEYSIYDNSIGHFEAFRTVDTELINTQMKRTFFSEWHISSHNSSPYVILPS
jgi:hypothetical protein